MVEDLAGRLTRWAGSVPVNTWSTSGLMRDLRTIYHDLNDTSWRRGKPTRSGLQTSPEMMGYRGEKVDRELWSEAIRAYLADPNYINQAAPRVAQAIRDHWNTHPELSRIIHFNAAGVPIPSAPIPDTLQSVTLPGGAPVASLGDLMAMGPLPTLPTDRPPLGPAWAEEYHAAYQDPSTPQFAARVAQEAAEAERRREKEARQAREQAIRLGRLIEA
ncbi:MAG: hypothetical protein IT534_02135 [Bauldia sp.]|nr:hypothetical protein [Bauldia sp.]